MEQNWSRLSVSLIGWLVGRSIGLTGLVFDFADMKMCRNCRLLTSIPFVGDCRMWLRCLYDALLGLTHRARSCCFSPFLCVAKLS